MYKLYRNLLIVALAIFSGIASADSFNGTYLGESTGIAKLVIKDGSVHGYGSCTPGMCDWGKAIKSSYSRDKQFLIAEFRPIGDKRQKLHFIIVINHTHDKNKISVSSVNYWKSESSVINDDMNTMTQQEFLILAK